MATLAPVSSAAVPTEIAQSVVALGAKASVRGWAVATGGNFSARVDAGAMAITATGTDKGALALDDILYHPLHDAPHPRASAETGIHLALYNALPEIGAVVHIHSPAGILVAISAAKGNASFYSLSGYELLKAIAGIKTHETTLNIPVFANSQHIPSIAAQADAYIASGGTCPAFLLVGHGLTTWGRTADEAFRHAEALEFLFQLDLDRRRYSI